MRLIFSGGGTGGHVYPALAMIEEAKERWKDCEILFIGRRGGAENRAIENAGIPKKELNVSGISRRLTPKNIQSVLRAILAEHSARKIIRDFTPDAVIGTGGYVCWPVLHAAQALGVPTLIHESNAYPGLVTRMLSPRCDRVLINTSKTLENLKRSDNAVEVGNPLRKSFGSISRIDARKRLRLSERDILILSFGGSIGASKLNEACINAMKSFSLSKRNITHIHGTGTRYFKEYEDSALAKEGGRCRILPYIDDMPAFLFAADIVICRCGAMTLSEISLAKTPAILIPSPNVTDDHQYKNARLYADAGGAIVITEDTLTADLLVKKLQMLAESRALRKKMSECISKFAKINSSKMCLEEIEAVIKSKTIRP